MARARISEVDGMAAVTEALQASASRDATATAVRYLLQALADKVPGNSVEVVKLARNIRMVLREVLSCCRSSQATRAR